MYSNYSPSAAGWSEAGVTKKTDVQNETYGSRVSMQMSQIGQGQIIEMATSTASSSQSWKQEVRKSGENKEFMCMCVLGSICQRRAV